MKKLSKFRHFGYRWIQFYLFQDGRWELGVSFDVNGHPLLSINFIFFHIEIEFAPKSYFIPTLEETERINRIKNLSDKEKAELIGKNIHDSIFGGIDK